MEIQTLFDDSNLGYPVSNDAKWHPFMALSSLRESGYFTDASIKAGSKTFPIHMAIMSTCSPYFKALFTNGRFNSGNKHLFVIPGVSEDVMEILIEFAYTKHVTITTDIVEQLLPAADQFHVNGVVRACCKFLTANLTPENCIGIHKFAQAYFCQKLSQESFRYLILNFCKVAVRSNEFLQFSADELYEILSNDELNVKAEETVFEALIRWIDFDPSCRSDHIGRLLSAVRLGLVSGEYLNQKVKGNRYMMASDACRPLIAEAHKIILTLGEGENDDSVFRNPLGRPRIPYELVFAIGGWSAGAPTNMVEVYDTRADRWVISGTFDESPRAYHGTATIEHKIYIVGGFDGAEYFNSVRCFDPVTKLWAEVAPINTKRCYVSVTVLNGIIYALGGFDGHIRHSTAERYQPSTNQWSFIEPMNYRRSDAGATATNGKLYICGGFNGHECLNNAEMFDPASRQWTVLASMMNRRSGLSVIAYKNHVYVMGGFNGISRIALVERYHPATNSWTTTTPMLNARSNFATEVIDDMIFAIGGFNGITTIYNVEYLDDTDEEWYEATDMNLYRSALSACVVSGLPNVEEYTHYRKLAQEKTYTKMDDDEMI